MKAIQLGKAQGFASKPKTDAFQHGTFDLASRPLIIAALRLQGPVALAVMAIVFLYKSFVS